MPSLDAAIEGQYLGFQCHQLGAQRGKARARHFREPGVIDIGNDFQQLLDAVASNRRYDPELCKAGADRVIIAVCWRINKCRVRCSVRQLCCSGVLVGTNRMFGLVTASQIASASAASFFWRLTYGFT